MVTEDRLYADPTVPKQALAWWTSTTLRISVFYVVSRLPLVSHFKVDLVHFGTVDWYGLRRNYDIDIVGFFEFKLGQERIASSMSSKMSVIDTEKI